MRQKEGDSGRAFGQSAERASVDDAQFVMPPKDSRNNIRNECFDMSIIE